jgi:DNA-binding PadR family transcriptional regulator
MWKSREEAIMNNFTLELLDYIQDVGRLLPGFLESPHEYVRRLKRPTYYKSLKTLEKKALIVKKRHDKLVFYSITEKGKNLLKKPAQLKKRNDGYSTIVIFDIPEQKSRQRTIFRRYLLRNGYSLLQESVLISPNVVTPELKELISELGLKDFITVVQGKIIYNF